MTGSMCPNNGWKIHTVSTVNAVTRLVALPAGICILRWLERPWQLYVGLPIIGAGLLMWLAFLRDRRQTDCEAGSPPSLSMVEEDADHYLLRSFGLYVVAILALSLLPLGVAVANCGYSEWRWLVVFPLAGAGTFIWGAMFWYIATNDDDFPATSRSAGRRPELFLELDQWRKE